MNQSQGERVKMEKTLPTTERVFTSQDYAGFRAMQVCVVADATDKEILDHCNADNPQQVTGGWHSVVNSLEDCKRLGINDNGVPGPCANVPGRIHKIVICM